MTREENLDWLYRLKSEIFVFVPKEWLIPMADALDDAIKALEQEPVIDKIRTEIDEVYEELDGYDPDSLGTFLARIDDIFDKYKAESEDKE